MPNLTVLFNHRLTPDQRTDAHQKLGAEQIMEPPGVIQHLWSHIPPEADNLSDHLAPVCAWLSTVARPGDFLLVQGEFGATFAMVNEALRLGMIPVYSTTRRQAVEEHQEDGSVHIRHTFAHVRYRCYTP